jgi:hypothetical protein
LIAIGSKTEREQPTRVEEVAKMGLARFDFVEAAGIGFFALVADEEVFDLLK